MLNSGDIVEVELGVPAGRETGFSHPGVIVTAQRILDGGPSVVHVVPLTTTIREFGSEIIIERDTNNGLDRRSAAQCQHVRSVSTQRIGTTVGSIGPEAIARIREMIAVSLDVPRDQHLHKSDVAPTTHRDHRGRRIRNRGGLPTLELLGFA